MATSRSDSRPKPTDLAFQYGWSCCVTGDADDGIEGSVRAAEGTSRVAMQRELASELGVDFKDIRIATRWGRMYTRQDVWDGPGRERARDDRMEELGVDVRMDKSRGEGLAAFYYVIEETGEEVPESYFEVPAVVPDDWEPNDHDAVWGFCSKDAPGATKLYVLED
jgi:hypothetical protein